MDGGGLVDGAHRSPATVSLVASEARGGAAVPSHNVRSEFRALSALAWPLVFTNLGNMALSLVDVAVVGRLGETSIAAAGLGNAVFFTVTLFGLGLVFGLDPLLAQAVGAGETERAVQVLAAGIRLALMASLPLTLAVLVGVGLIDWLNLPTATVVEARAYLYARLASMAPFLLLIAVRSYLQAVGKPRALVEGVVVANAVNLPVAWALTLGVPALGITGLGVAGAGLATVVATLVQLVVSARPLLLDAAMRAPPLRGGDRTLLKRAAMLGAPIGFQVVAEAGSFSLVTFLVGAFGTRALSGHQVALTLVSCTFQVALGIGAATSVRVGAAVGRGDVAGTRRAGFVGIAAGSAVMLASALILFAAPRALARALTDDANVVEASLPFLFVAACFQLADGAQTVAQGALRGAGDTRFPLLLNLAGHWVVGIPLGLALARALDLGPQGLWWGLCAGLTAVALSAAARFAAITRRRVARA